MRQIAVLPYRFDGPGMDGPIEILLFTSRGTGRWVIPKGNPLIGMPRHASAAGEAEDDAAVIGAVCPTPLGRYQFRPEVHTVGKACVRTRSSRRYAYHYKP